MTDKTTKTLPQDVIDRALEAMRTIRAWNGAVHLARSLEALVGCPGKYEHDLIDAYLWGQNNLAIDTLNKLEQAYRAKGWSPDQLYQAIGYSRPEAVRQSDDILLWRGMGPR